MADVALLEAGSEALQWAGKILMAFEKEIKELGFPPYQGGVVLTIVKEEFKPMKAWGLRFL